MSSTGSFYSAHSTRTMAAGTSAQNFHSTSQALSLAKEKYSEAASACSTAAVAASNTASFYTSALRYFDIAMDTIAKAANGNIGCTDYDTILASCQIGIKNAVIEAVEASANANAAAEMAEGIAFETCADAELNGEWEDWKWLFGENDEEDEEGFRRDGDESEDWFRDRGVDSFHEDEDDDELSVLGEEFLVTESVMDEWIALKANLARAKGRVQTLHAGTGTAADTDSDSDTASTHADDLDLDLGVPLYTPDTNTNTTSTPSGRSSTPPPKSCWGTEIGEFSGGLVTQSPSSDSLYTGFGEITEALVFDTFVLVEPTAEQALAGFQRVTLPELRLLAKTVYETRHRVGDESWGFLLTEEDNLPLMSGVGRVVGFGMDESICIVKKEGCEEGVGRFDVCMVV